MTPRLYLLDAYRTTFDAAVTSSADGWCSLSQTLFHPGGGGQPHDRGELTLEDDSLPVAAVREDDAGVVWHHVGRDLRAGSPIRGTIDWQHRYAVMRHHALMHVVNTVAMQRFRGLITGVQIGPARSRIDLKLDGFTREQVPELEARVQEVVDHDLEVRASVISEDEFRRRPELVRTLNVLPPVVEGRVRVVEVVGFDAQACGGTHVHSTGEIGQAHVVKFDNKGKDNKRFYWELSRQNI
jgi:misacylated tRNA(Ala) deacylase